jgi:assimilatory nitrate reductase catalytic subunit
MFREWSSPEAVFQIMKRLSRGLPCDITGIEDYVMIDREGGIQWPLPEGAILASNERRLFEDGAYFTRDRKAKFFVAEPSPLPEPTSVDYPFLLLTGRGSSSQWHTQTRTKRSDVLNKLAPSELYIELSPVDARALGIRPDERVKVSSRRATVDARAFVTNSVRPGEVFMPMHYETMNRLTFAAFDPYSRQPAYKASAVAILKIGEVH